jgi:hypothetical protein
MVNHLVVRFGSFPFAVQNSFILRLEKGLFDRRKVVIAIIIIRRRRFGERHMVGEEHFAVLVGVIPYTQQYMARPLHRTLYLPPATAFISAVKSHVAT